jgi:formate-dependent nitrite reductase membrane component NrfD
VSEAEVTREGLQGVRPGREALTGVHAGRRRWRKRRGEQPVVPPTEFTSYYGRPVINSPVWSSLDIAGYLFLGGLAGAGSLLGAGAQLTGRPALAKTAKAGALAAACLSLAGLVHDLGRPARFLNMMRTFKVTSPMSVGSWILSGYVPVAGVAGLSAVTGRLPRTGTAATAAAAALAPALASYTAALLSNTAVPAWHDGYPEMPFVFVGSAATAAGGLGLLGAPVSQSSPARNMALIGVCTELAAFQRMTRRIGMAAEPYHSGRGGAYMKASETLSALGLAGALLGRRSRLASALSGAALMAASAATRWGFFHAGLVSADDPTYTVVPQRERLRTRAQANGSRAANPGLPEPAAGISAGRS